jgi:hypothetical protein
LEEGLDLSEMFTEDELSALLTKMADRMGAPELVDDQDNEYMGAPPPEIETRNGPPETVIRLHFTNTEDIPAFAALIGQDVTPETRRLWFPPRPKE